MKRAVLIIACMMLGHATSARAQETGASLRSNTRSEAQCVTRRIASDSRTRASLQSNMRACEHVTCRIASDSRTRASLRSNTRSEAQCVTRRIASDSRTKASLQSNMRAKCGASDERSNIWSEAQDVTRSGSATTSKHVTCRIASDSRTEESAAESAVEVDARQISLRVMLGFPWNGARVDLDNGSGKWGAFAEFDMAFLNRLQPTFGVKRTLLGGERLKTWAEFGLGHQYQYGTLSQQGPSAVALLGAELGARRIFGYGWLRSRHTLLLDRVTIQTGPGEEIKEWETTHLWSPGFALGMGRRVGTSKRWSWQGGIDWRFVDRGKLGFVLPGLHGMITVTL